MSASTEPDKVVPIEPIRPDAPQLQGKPLTRLLTKIKDSVICLGFALLAFWLTAGLWPDPDTRTLALNPADQILVEWFLSYGSHVFSDDFGLVTDKLNAPDGINMLANAGTLGLGALFAPVTWAFGAPTTFAVIMAFNLAATASGWYLLFSRTIGTSRFAAVIGGLFCGFAPGMISQANSHLHMTSQWLVPVMVWCVIKLVRLVGGRGEPSKIIAVSVFFGLVVTVQVFIGEETLFLTALTLALVTVGYLLLKRPPWAQIWRFAAALALSAAVAFPLLAYPLWMQFKGPQSVPNGVFSSDYFVADLASFVAISPLSWLGSEEAAKLSTGPAEYNTFWGWPLVLVVLGLAVWLRRQVIAMACLSAGLVMVLLSLGPIIVHNRQRTSIDGPYQMLKGIPVIDGALPLRFALAAIPLIAILLVLGIEKSRTSRVRGARFAVPVIIGLALLPLVPIQLPTEDREPVPRFYAEGHWRQCASDGDVIVPVPLPTPSEPEPMRYATSQRLAFGLPEGFFIGPYGRKGRATIGTWKRPTSALLAEVAKTGKVPEITDNMRAQARTDLARWKASCVVLTEHPRERQLGQTLEGLFGPGQRVADAVIWPL